MAGEENWQYHRSPSSALQGLHEQSSLMSNGSNKSQQKQSSRKKASTSVPVPVHVPVPVPVPVQKSASEKLSWLTSSPLLLRSPARESMTKKKGGGKRSTAMFSARVRGGRGRYEEEEEAAAAREDEEDPTSPTVSCIGQVKPCRSKAMSKGPSSSSMASGASRESVSSGAAAAASTSSSPARFFMSPARGRHSTWTSFFGSPRKGSSASSAGHGHGHEDMQDSKRSLWATVFRKHNQHAGGEGWDGIMNGVPSHISASSSSYSSANNADMKCHIRNAIPAGHCRVPSSKLHGGPQTSAQHGVTHKSTYEELPPLQSGICNIQDLKVSLEVVPETWLARDGERLRSGAARAQPCLPDRSMEEEDGQVPLAQEGQVFGSSAFSSINQDAQAIAQTLQRASCDGEAHIIEASGTQSKDSEKKKTTTTTSTTMKKKIFFLGSTADSRRSYPTKTKKPGSDNDGGDLDKKRFDHTDLYENLAKSFGTLIVVGYDLNENAASHELAPASGEKLFAGAFQVAGFNEAGRRYLKLFQAGNAEFIRSRSVTSQRKTVMRLQRCNSEPWKPSN